MLAGTNLAALAAELAAGRGIAHKRDIDAVVRLLGPDAAAGVRVGDDCAAIPDGDGFLLLAIEGFLNEFVAAAPRFAGWCGVMVNVSDVYAMGGRPIAVVDAVWSADAPGAAPILEGLRDAAAAYGVPLVGGHTNARADRGQLSVAVLGRARRLLTSFDARPGDALVAAIDLRGRWHDPFPYWNASMGADGMGADPGRLRGDLEILPRLAEDGLCRAAKDISMGGVIGTALMLLECSGVGAVIDIAAVPAPPDAPPARWLGCFPSFGFLLAVPPAHVPAVLGRFAARGVTAATIGACDGSGRLELRAGAETAVLWDFADQPLIGCAPVAA